MPKSILFLNYWRSPLWLQISASAVRAKIAQGFAVDVLDVSSSHFPDQLPYPGSQRGFHHGESPVASFFRNLGASYKEVDRRDLLSRSHTSFLKDQKAPFERAVLSNIYSFFRNDQPNHGSRILKFFRSKTSQYAIGAYASVITQLQSKPYALVIVPNGRLASQAMLTAAARDCGVPVEFLELSDVPGRYYLRGYSPHDRIKVQNEMMEFFQSDHAESYRKTYAAWSSTRSGSNSGINPFSARWQKGIFVEDSVGDKGLGKLAIFTSSQDELWSLGPQWALHNWSDQYEAFDQVLSFLKPDFTAVLRVHPNLMNKHPKMIAREVQRIKWLKSRHPTLQVFDHMSPVNSYEILNWADSVIVSSSTIGLEALAANKRVVNTYASYYDLLCETNQIHAKEDLHKLSELKSAVPEKAWSWVAFHSYTDPEISFASHEVSEVFAGPKLWSYVRALLLSPTWLGLSANVYFWTARKCITSVENSKNVIRKTIRPNM